MRSFEEYSRFYNDYKSGTNLRPGGAPAKFTFTLEPYDGKAYRLFTVGQSRLFYQWMDEPDYPIQYRSISDALDSTHALRDRFCLDMSSDKPERFVRRVYKKVMWPPVLAYLNMHPVPDIWRAGIHVTAEDLTIEQGGYLRMEMDIYYRREDTDPRSTANAPDQKVTIDIPAGTYSREFLETIEIPADKCAHVGVWIEGEGYSGRLYLEHPVLEGDGFNLLPCFDAPVTDEQKFDWSAQNLSRKERPYLDVSLNGHAIFSGQVFTRCHMDSEWSIDLPRELLRRDNTLEISLRADYHDPVPYDIHEMGIISRDDASIVIVACPDVADMRAGARVLIRTAEDNAHVTFSSPDGRLECRDSLTFAEKGLHGITLRADKPGLDIPFTLTCGGCTASGAIGRMCEKGDDAIVTGTGDMIYIEQDMTYTEEYLSWYISNGIGNQLTIRPTYRWSGTRVLDPEVWKTVTRVLDEMDIKWVLMKDGRELPGINCNPDDRMLAGKGYMGSQLHERDGAQFYWGSGNIFRSTPTQEAHNDMCHRMYRSDPEHINPDYCDAAITYRPEGLYYYREPDTPKDTRKAAAARIKSIAAQRTGEKRHTGPAVMFKYMQQAGFDWVGAETMYGSMEPIMAFLRGARLHVGSTDMGVHHAVQWSSSPQDVPEHFRRYRLALYCSYIQGATQINTEEGLWHLEEYYSHFHRFSDACAGHRLQQQDFARYVRSHTRSGVYDTSIAFVHGRYDGWHAFGRSNPWGWLGESETKADESWQLIKLFWPLSRPGEALYLHGCDTDHAVGYHSGTPLGNPDVIPAEADISNLSRYKALMFAGYNCFEADDRDKFSEYVRRGGTLLLTAAHLTDTTALCDIRAQRLAPGAMSGYTLTEAHIGGKSINIYNVDDCDEVLERTDEGLPLAVRKKLGQGEVYLVTAPLYPADETIRGVYERLMLTITNKVRADEYIKAETGNDVEYAIYSQPDGSKHVYFLAVDWYNKSTEDRHAALIIGKHRYDVSIPWGSLIKCVVNGDTAVWPHDEICEVLSVKAGKARLQGEGHRAVTAASNGHIREYTVDLSNDGTAEVDIG